MAYRTIQISVKNHTLNISYFLRSGSGDVTLFYLHGIGCYKADFLAAAEIPALSSYNLVAFDYPGCGESEYPNHLNLDLDDLVEIAAQIIKKLKLKNIVLFGHSMGGAVGLLLIRKYPEHIKGFVNIDGNLAEESCIFTKKISETRWEEFKQQHFPQLKELLRNSGNLGFTKWAEIIQQYSSARAMYNYCPSLVRYSSSGELLEQFLKLNIPHLFIYGAESPSINYLTQLMSAATVELIPQSSHFPFYDNPKMYYRAVQKFLKQVTQADLSASLKA